MKKAGELPKPPCRFRFIYSRICSRLALFQHQLTGVEVLLASSAAAIFVFSLPNRHISALCLKSAQRRGVEYE